MLLFLRALFLPFLVIMLGSGFLARILKSRIAQILPFYLIGIGLIFYTFGYFDQLELGYIVTIALSVIPELICIIYRLIKKQDAFAIYKGSDFLLAAVVYLVLFILDWNRFICQWDDAMHWAPFAKETYRLMSFYNNSDAIAIHRDYPPIWTSYRVFWVYLSGAYNESLLYLSTQFLCLSCFLPMLSRFKAKDFKKSPSLALVGFGIFIVLTMLISNENIGLYNTLYLEVPLAILTAFALYLIRKEQNFGWPFYVKLGLIFSFMILSKQIAPLYIGYAIIYLVARIIKNKQQRLIRIAKTFATLIIPLVLSITWHQYVEKRGISGQFSEQGFVNSAVELLHGLLASNLQEWQTAALQNYILNVGLDTRFILGCRYFQIIFVIILIMIYFAKNKAKTKNHGEKQLLLGYFAFIGIVHVVITLATYLTIFGSAEAILNQSHERYLGYIWNVALSLGIMFAIDWIEVQKIEKYQQKLAYAFFVILLVISDPYVVITMAHKDYCTERYQDAINLISKTTNEDDKIYIVDQSENGENLILLYYYLMPIKTNPFDVEGRRHTTDYSDDFYVQTRTAAEFRENLESYQYLYISRIDEGFTERYSELFDSTPEEGGLYKISDNTLELVGQAKIEQ